MANVWAILRRDVQAYFASPVAYVVLAFFVFLFGFFFVGSLDFFMASGSQMASMGRGQTLNVNEHLIRDLWLNLSVILLFLMPLVTMRSFAEEHRAGTIELLLTSPVTDLQLVLGKFLAALTLYGCMLGLTLFHIALLFAFGEPEWKPVVVGYFGLLLFGASFIALGLAFSSITKNQIVAAFLSFGTFLALWLVIFLESWAGPWASLVRYLSVMVHFQNFAKGVIDLRDVFYYLSFIGLGLFFCRQSLASLRFRG